MNLYWSDSQVTRCLDTILSEKVPYSSNEWPSPWECTSDGALWVICYPYQEGLSHLLPDRIARSLSIAGLLWMGADLFAMEMCSMWRVQNIMMSLWRYYQLPDDPWFPSCRKIRNWHTVFTQCRRRASDSTNGSLHASEIITTLDALLFRNASDRFMLHIYLLLNPSIKTLPYWVATRVVYLQ